MNKSRTQFITTKELTNKYNEGHIFLDLTQREPSFVDGIVKKHLYYAVTNKSTAKYTAAQQALIDTLGGLSLDNGWHGDCAIRLVLSKNKFACSDGGHRLETLSQFFGGTKCKDFSYPDNSEIAKFYEKLAATMGKSTTDSFTFSELPTKYQKALETLPLYCSITTSKAKNAAGEDFIDTNKQKNQSSVNILNGTFAKTDFYQIFSETAKCISAYNLKKGLEPKSTPSWYDGAKKNTKKAYEEVCKGLKFTGKKHDAIFKLLLRCANCAEWEGGTSKVAHYNICDTYSKMSKTSCNAIIMNTIDNMAMVPKLLDTEYLAGINVWTAVVYTFGVPAAKSYAARTLSSAERKPLALSERFLKNRKQFNNAFGDCISGNKSTFKGSNFCLNQEGGTVFVPQMLRESPSGRKNLTAVSMVLTAIYNEIKEVK